MAARLVDRHLGLILLLPSLVFFVTLLLYPLGYGIWVSLFSRHLLDPGGTFIGLGNYAWLLTNGEFWSALAHSVVWARATVGLKLLLHARYFTLQLAESYLTAPLFRQILARIERLAWYRT
jgi:multiple sugar transport system permease protein